MDTKRILSVGQCAADHYSISQFFRTHFPDFEVEPVNTAVQVKKSLETRSYGLVLVNRLFDLDGDSGIDLIRSMKADGKLADVPVMLVSNHASAQKEAMDAGAAPGFGKAKLDASAKAAITAALAE